MVRFLMIHHKNSQSIRSLKSLIPSSLYHESIHKINIFVRSSRRPTVTQTKTTTADQATTKHDEILHCYHPCFICRIRQCVCAVFEGFVREEEPRHVRWSRICGIVIIFFCQGGIRLGTGCLKALLWIAWLCGPFGIFRPSWDFQEGWLELCQASPWSRSYARAR